jgi:hypothetical protein
MVQRLTGYFAFVLVLLAGFFAAGGGKIIHGASPAYAAAAPSFGVYRGAANPTAVAQYSSWLGRPVDSVVDFESQESWSTISSPDWWLSGWQGKGYKLILSVPMVPGTSYLSDSSVSSMLQQGASGAFNGYFRTLAQKLSSYGFSDAWIRLGWEMNGGWFNWRAAPNPTAWVAYWKQIVTTMRQANPSLRFIWNPNVSSNQLPTEQVYPGDSYVDYIGVDVYDQAWGPNGSIVSDPATRWSSYILGGSYGLSWFASFAKSHGKPLTVPEWGATIRSDGHGGGDDPYYITQMHSFIANPANNVAWSSYFEFDAPDGTHRLSSNEMPNAATAFKTAFGVAPATTTTTTTTTPTTTTTASTGTTTTTATTTSRTTTTTPTTTSTTPTTTATPPPTTTTTTPTTTTVTTTPSGKPKGPKDPHKKGPTSTSVDFWAGGVSTRTLRTAASSILRAEAVARLRAVHAAKPADVTSEHGRWVRSPGAKVRKPAAAPARVGEHGRWVPVRRVHRRTPARPTRVATRATTQARAAARHRSHR